MSCRVKNGFSRLSAEAVSPVFPALLFTFMATVVMRLLFLRSFIDTSLFLPIGGDRGLYHNLAAAIARGDFGSDVFTFLPLYPHLLGLFYAVIGEPNLAATGAAQAILDGLTALLLFGMAHRRYGRTAGIIAGLGFAFLGAAATYSLVSMPVSLGLFWTALTATLSDVWWDRWNQCRAAVMGLVLGIGGQIFGAFWLMIVPLAILIALSGKSAKPMKRIMIGISVVMVGYACLLPTLAVNVMRGGEWVLTTAHGGLNFFMGNNPAAHGYGIALPGARTSAEEMTRDFRTIASETVGTPLTIRQADRFWRDAALNFWRTQPLAASMLLVKKAHRLASIRDFDDTGLCRLLPEQIPELRISFVGFGLVWILACIGLPWRRPRFNNSAPLIMAGCYALGILMTFVSARYRLPIAVLFLPAAAGTLTTLPDFFRTVPRVKYPGRMCLRAYRVFTPRFAAACLLIVMALIPHPLPDIRLPDDLNRSAYSLRDGDISCAFFYAERAALNFPWSAEAWFALGNAYAAKQDYVLALDAYNRTLEISPNRTDAMFNAGNVLLRIGETDTARLIYERVVEINPGHAKAWFALALVYRDSRDFKAMSNAITMAAELAGWDHPQVMEFLRERSLSETKNPGM